MERAVLGWAVSAVPAPVRRALSAVLLAPAAPSPAQAQAAAVLDAAHQFYVAIDEAGDVLAWNAAAERTFGWSAEEALGRSAHHLIIPRASHAAHLAGIERFRRTGRGRGIDGPVEVEALTRSGGTVPVELGIWAQQTSAGWLFHVLGSDISARKAQERVLSLLAEHRQGLLRSDDADEVRALLVDTARAAVRADGAYLLELSPVQPAGDGRVALSLVAQSRGLADPALSEVQLDRQTVQRLEARGRVAVADLTGDPSPGAALLRAAGLRSAVAEALRTDGGLLGVLVLGWVGPRPLPDEADQRLLGLLASEATLVVERLAVQERLSEAARTDALTGLLNRRAFGEDVERAIARAAAEDRPQVLVMLDLDGFKGYNDAHGHPAGDAHLQAVAAAWRSSLGAEPAELYRFGGDEFALLLPCDAGAAEDVVTRLVAATPGPTGVTTGLARVEPGDSAELLLARADAALYARKRARPVRR